MRYLPLSLGAALLAYLFTGCEYNSVEELYPDSFCDTTRAPTYSDGVRAVLAVHCDPCHAGSDPVAGFVIDSYETLHPFAENGGLLCTIEHGDDCQAMPVDAPKLPDCDIELIRSWIANGALDD